MSEVVVEVSGKAGRITLNRPKALNALSLDMIRALTSTLLQWRDDPRVEVVTIRGTGKEGPFGSFCAGGDIRFFHAAALAGDPALEAFFTEEYTLNHLVHGYAKPYVAFMDGIVMGGGMGISQGARCRIVTERTKMAMPETNIGLFPDVGGGYFLSRSPGRLGEYLALTGEMIGATDAVDARLADISLPSGELPSLWDRLAIEGSAAVPVPHRVEGSPLSQHRPEIDRIFALPTVPEIVSALEAETSDWARHTAAALRKRSPLMLHVVLEQVRRARAMNLADDLRMERDLVHHCFHLRPGAASETVEGIRALAVDKDHSPRWNPARIEDVTPAMVAPFFASPWPAEQHPLRGLA
ncbi:enoyl-CoA hydratase/isomerase family protein [Ramlibacter humi]|uniref:Enoyl-CoA hydratase/isomerase family protein n=1 Tax=Ramlibacter humi TaxID=2530451 RepID=A0A4Z0CBI5_9BURK|nr:enoyl-CoA hydratase/isomerase family protein [Ramlibacter humi]TFZ08252.1 enoyl-CoA hydratase/isomerase family protein [Ramlibacter humi]